jgi:hypothetical protein
MTRIFSFGVLFSSLVLAGSFAGAQAQEALPVTDEAVLAVDDTSANPLTEDEAVSVVEEQGGLPDGGADPALATETSEVDADGSENSEPVVAKPIPLSGLSMDVPVEKAMYEQLVIRKPPVDIEKMPSLFLTVWERDLIINARKGLVTRDPEAPDTTPEVASIDLSMFESPRDLRLSGIVYRGSKDWVIWLNAKRIAPNALPPEIMNIKVFKDYVEMEWFDARTNQIFPVRMRPHQRFNLDARVFLPG